VAKKVAAKLAGSSDLATLAYPTELAGEGYTYQNACSLWDGADFEAQFGPREEAFVEMTYAEVLTPEAQLPANATESAYTKCVLGTKELDGAFTNVDAYYYPNAAKAQAGYNSYASADNRVVPGLGDKAVLQPYDAAAGQYEVVMVLRGTTLFKVQFVPASKATRGNSQVQADVTAMAQKVLSRLK
jgi:hypothetical protein